MMRNLVKVKDEEIRQLKRQLGVSELGQDTPVRTNASPLRASRKSESPSVHEGLRPRNLDGELRLEDQLAMMNQETLEEQVRALI